VRWKLSPTAAAFPSSPASARAKSVLCVNVAPSAVEQREVDAALGEQLRQRARDVAGAADRENAHVHDVTGVG
jgi:hypothetical protein